MSNKDNEEEKITSSPGFYAENLVFEQIAEHRYVTNEVDPSQSSTPKTSLNQTVDGVTYTPMTRCPWFLAKEAIVYGNEKDLWNEIRKFIYDHVFLPEEALYDVATAWVLSTWIYELWTVVPYLFFYGPVSSGKTRAMEVLQRLSYRGILASNISSAALYRAINEWHTTLFLDETEIYNKENKIEIIGILNSGYRKGQYAIRAKSTERGVELEVFDVFGFKSLAGTQGMMHALESRSIMVRMIKNRRKINKQIDERKADELRGKLLCYRLNKLSNLENGEPFEQGEPFTAVGGTLNLEDGRLTELFTCLLAVSNHGRANIIKYAQELEEIRLFEEKASDEAEIIEILSKTDIIGEKDIALTKDIAEVFNKNRPEKERYKTTSVGWLIRELGFNKVHTKQGSGWQIKKDRLHYWQQIYQTTVDTQLPLYKNVQNVQSIHQPIATQDLTDGLKVCCLCGQPITGGIYDTYQENEYSDVKPCHTSCYENRVKGKIPS